MSIRNARHHRHDNRANADTAYLRFPHARYQRPDGSMGTITLDVYMHNPNPEMTLLCPNCPAHLVFRHGSDFVAGTPKEIKPHFATRSGSEHDHNCRFQPNHSHESVQPIDKTRGLRLNFNLRNSASLPDDGTVIPIQRGRRGRMHLPDDIAKREAKPITEASNVACLLRTVPNDRRADSLVIHEFRATEWQQFFVDMRPAADRLEKTRTARDLADAILSTRATQPVAALFVIDQEQMDAMRTLGLAYEIYGQPTLSRLKSIDGSDASVTPRLVLQSDFAVAVVKKPGVYLAIGFPDLSYGPDDAHFYMDMNIQEAGHICRFNPAKIQP